MIDPTILLDSKPVQIQTPLQAQGQLLGLQNLAGANQLQQQQITGAGLENQQRQVQLNAQRAMDQAMQTAFTKNPDGSGYTWNRDAISQSLIQAGAGHLVPGLMNTFNEMDKNLAEAKKATADAQTATADYFGTVGAGIRANGYDPNAAILGVSHAAANKAIPPDQAQQLIARIQQNPTPEAVKALVDPIIAASPKQRQLDIQATKDQADADLSKAKIPGAQAESQMQQTKAALQQQAVLEFRANPQAGGQIIDRVLPASVDAPANASYKAAWQSAMQTGGPDAAQKVVEAAATHAGEISKATNPAIRAANVAQSVAIEGATAPIKVGEQVQAEIEKAKLAPGAFSSVLDPVERAKAVADYQKSSEEAADKVGAAKQLQDFVAAAQSGNKAAPGLIPIAEVRQLLNRVNRTELQSVSSGAGSGLDRVKGFFDKWTEGQPIPPAVLADTAKIANTMANAAQRTYEYKVAINRQTYGSKAQPVTLPTQVSQGSAGVPAAVQNVLKSVGPGIHTLSDGSVWQKAADGTISKQ